MANENPADKIFVGKSGKPEYLALRLANRHGLATGATGTGKTVTLQVLAEGFSRAGVPVFAADIKGDLSGVSAPGEPKDFLLQRAKDVGITYQPDQFPVVFWDLFGEQGHPIRTTVFEMGPLLISRMFGLNDTQEGVINIAFKFADDEFGAQGLRQQGSDRPQGSARAAQLSVEEHQDDRPEVRQRRHRDGRRRAAPVAGAGKSGRVQILRRACTVDRRHDEAPIATAAVSSTSCLPTS